MNFPLNAVVLDAIIKEFKLTKGAELGVRRGELTASLLEHNPNLTMVCVDIWEAKHPALNEEYCPYNLAFFQSYLQQLGVGDRAFLYKKLTTEACHDIPNETLDFIFLDATHTYNALEQDICCWSNKVKPGGFIVGHDWHPAFDDGRLQQCIQKYGHIRKIIEIGNRKLDNLRPADYCTQEIITWLKTEKEGIADELLTCWYKRV